MQAEKPCPLSPEQDLREQEEVPRTAEDSTLASMAPSTLCSTKRGSSRVASKPGQSCQAWSRHPQQKQGSVGAGSHQ